MPERTRSLIVLGCLTLAAMALSVLLVWQGTQSWAQRRISELVARAVANSEREADAIGRAIESRIGYLRGLPWLLADDEEVRRTTMFPAETTEDADRPSPINLKLGQVARQLGLDLVLLLDANGRNVAASNHGQPESLIGSSHGDRAYFLDPARGESGEQYAVGRRTNIPGLFFSAPITADTTFAGAVVIKLDMARLSHWVAGSDSYITDANGVVILASDRRLVMRASPTASVFNMSAQEREAIYRRTEFAPIRIQPAHVAYHPRVVLFGDQATPHVMAREAPDASLTVHVLSPLTSIDKIRSDARWAFAFMAIGGMALVGLVAFMWLYLQRVRTHGANMTAANSKLGELNDELRHQATTDVLTGCANRRRFMELFEKEIARSIRHGTRLGLLMFDIDHFKRVNDTYGHACGDAALKHCCRIAGAALRTDDLLARVGGEEFAALLPETDEAGADVLGERVRGEIERSPVMLEGQPVTITVSIGACAFGEGARSTEAMLQEADRALYIAKHGGRNRVVRASSFVAA